MASTGAATPPAPVPSTAQAREAEVVLRYANRPIVGFHTPYLGMSPMERARRSARNIDSALDQGGPGQVKVQATEQGQLIFIDDEMVIILHPGDVDPLSGDTLQSLAERTVEALTLSIQETREARDTRSLGMGVAYVAAATGVAVALYLVLAWVRRHTLEGLHRWLHDYSHRLGAGASTVLRAGRIRRVVEVLDALLRWGAALILAYTWLSFCLQRFPYTRPWGEELHRYLIDVALELGRGILGAIPGLVVAVIILLLARAAVGVLRSLFYRIEHGQIGVGWMSRDAAGPTRRVATWVVWIFALAMAYPYLPGAETEAFKGMSVLVGLMLSLGASSFVGQVAGGLILTYSGMLRRGEYVRIGEHEGTVVAVGAFNTRIRTGLGEEITLPNSVIVNSPTKNYSREVEGPGYIMDTVVTIGYDTPWRQVEAMLIEAARRTPDVLHQPAPRVFQTALSDYYPEYRLVCQAIPEQPRPRAEILSALHANIQDVFNEHGVQIMSPHYVMDPGQEKVVPPDRWYAAPARRPEPPRSAA
jgi:small-conductance mechanosensitive channel